MILYHKKKKKKSWVLQGTSVGRGLVMILLSETGFKLNNMDFAYYGELKLKVEHL